MLTSKVGPIFSKPSEMPLALSPLALPPLALSPLALSPLDRALNDISVAPLMAEWVSEPQGVYSSLGQGLYTISGNRESAMMGLIKELQAQVANLTQQLSAVLPTNVKVRL